MDIASWLRSLGLERYEAAFRENEIDETVLRGLTSEDLKDLGVGAVGHRRKLLDAIAARATPECRSRSAASRGSGKRRRTSPCDGDFRRPGWFHGAFRPHGP